MPALLNPLLLWGLGAAAVPIVIHLLNKRRFQRQPWAAMEWLLAAAKKTQKRLTMENLLLLLARTCAVLFLALALTRPSFSHTPLLLGTQRQTHLYVLLDNSASTAARSGGRPVIEESLSAVSSLVAALSDDDPVTLLLTNANWGEGRHSGRPAVILRETRDHGAVRRRLGEIKPAAARADLADALKTLEESVPGEGAVLRRVAIVSDFQVVTVEGLRDRERKEDPIRPILERLKAKGAEVVPVVVGREIGNVAITDLRSQDDRDIVQGATAIFHAEIRNFSDRTVKVEVKFTVDGEERGASSQFVQLPPRSAGGEQAPSAIAEYWTTFTERDVGVHNVVAKIETDALPLDDERSLAFTVRPQIKVLLVDGEPNPPQTKRSRDGEVEWLHSAIGLLEEHGPFAPTPMTEERFRALPNLNGWDVIVLANVARPAPTDQDRKRLEEFVRSGGSLFLTVGDQVDPARWNEEIYRREGGLLPVQIGAPVGDAREESETVFKFDLSANRHPMLAAITDPANSVPFDSPLIRRFLKTPGIEAEKDARVVLRLTDLPRSPILVEKRFGKGNVLLYLSTIDDDWGNFLGSFLFPALAHEAIHHMTSRGNAERNLLAFQSWTRAVPPNFVTMKVTKPDGSDKGSDRDVSADASYVSFGETELPGIYRAVGELKPTDLLSAAPPPLKDMFAVNLNPLESDLRRVHADDVHTRWTGLVQRSESAAVAAEEARARAGEIAVPLLCAALLCLLLEIYLVQRIGRRRNK